MSYKIKIDIDALEDIKKGSEWHENQSKGLGIRFKNQVKSHIVFFKKNPYLFSIKYKSIRCRKIEKFPFLIHYFINEELKNVFDFAVFHTSRNPEIWNKIDK